MLYNVDILADIYIYIYILVSLYNPVFNNLPFKAPILTDIDAKPERPGVVSKTAAYLVLNQL